MSLVQQASLVNPQNAHFSNPGYSSSVGAVTGCGGSGSELALQQKGLYEVITGGRSRSKGRSKGKRISGKSAHRSKKSRKNHRGGNGYGMSISNDQSLASTSGPSAGHADLYSYQSNGINSDQNMNASKQSGGNTAIGSSYGTGGYPYYSYKPTEGENLSTFAGSGYPPMTRGLNSQCGGKKRKSRRVKKSGKKQKSARNHSSKRRSSKGGKRKSHRKKARKQKGGYSQYMTNVANAHNYSTGAPPMLGASSSALANPVPYVPHNDCLDTWKHLGDTPPYNKIM